MTQARTLWKGAITVAEIDILRQSIVGLELDDYLNVLDSSLDIITRAGGARSLDECLEAFRVIQGWWGTSQ